VITSSSGSVTRARVSSRVPAVIPHTTIARCFVAFNVYIFASAECRHESAPRRLLHSLDLGCWARESTMQNLTKVSDCGMNLSCNISPAAQKVENLNSCCLFSSLIYSDASRCPQIIAGSKNFKLQKTLHLNFNF